MIWLILVGVMCSMIYYMLSKRLRYWEDRGVVHRKMFVNFDFLKMLFQKTSMFDHIHNLYKEFSNERYFGDYQVLRPTLFLNDLDLIKRVTVKDYEYFIDHTNIVPEDVDPLMGKNLINLKGQRWRDMRAALSPSFTSNKMKMMFTLVSECAQELTTYFEKQNMTDVEMKEVFTRFTNDAIASVAFGYKCNSLVDKENEFYLMGKKATNFSGFTFFAFIMHSAFPKLAKFLKLRLLSNSATNFFRRVITDNIRKRENEGLVRADMIYLLMEARKSKQHDDSVDDDEIDSGIITEKHVQKRSKMEISDDDITAQALIFFFGGFDTSSTLMSFTAYELALNPRIQKQLQKEIDETLEYCNGKLTYEAVNKMKYMDMVVSVTETLRMWPPGFMIDRLCVKDYLIEPVNAWEKPLHVEKGMMIKIPVVGIHHNPIYYPHPELFDPERFNDDNKQNMEPFSYLPFGSGPRICIASRFALMETKIIISHLLSKFNLIRTDKTPYPIKHNKNSFNLGPVEGFWLGLEKRSAE